MKYKLKEAPVTGGCREEVTAGAVVYDLVGYDYGLALDDTLSYGEPYFSVTLNEDGSYPGFTVPARLLEVL